MRSATVAGVDRVSGVRRRRSVRTTSAKTSAFDADLGDLGGEQPADELLQPGGGVGDGEAAEDLAVGVQDADDMVVLRPVDTGADSRWDAQWSDTHGCFLAVRAVSQHPVVPGLRSRSLIDRRSPAHSPVAGLGILGHPTSQNSRWTSKVERPWRWPGGDQGVHQRFIGNCRHEDGPPMNGPFADRSATMLASPAATSAVPAPRRQADRTGTAAWCPLTHPTSERLPS